jgi:hypothetical protein
MSHSRLVSAGGRTLRDNYSAAGHPRDNYSLF